jgi:hypothetical protein
MRNEMTEGWRKMHNEELKNLYFSPNIIRMWEIRNAYRIFIGKLEGKRPLRRTRHR